MNIKWKIIPKSRLDKVAFSTILIGIHIAKWFYHTEILPSRFKHLPWHDPVYLLHFTFSVICYFNVMVCIWKISSTDTTSGSVILPSVLKPKWFYCSVCVCNAPPRSFHCDICDRCILKRDHHCLFIGTCIGHNNFRYFILLLFYVTIASFYSTLMFVRYTLTEFGRLSFSYLFSIIVPILAWLFGVLYSPHLLACFLTGLSSLVFIAVISCLLYHVRNIYNGQTTYERRSKKHDYNLGWKRNFLDALGKNYHISWICPLINSPLPGDGINFTTRDMHETAKSL
ncbi:probable palmitoyltransferase ZDHHC24 [Octopus vulgaris]|uniref:Palmitoyltransferase n=1 Tax=Octopus vulgaris TaxID=6645 RepID=A0AA36ALS7_OCTVU|nr:probable palmitoyltransferase ZDHHC24 [Octopus vulgaris]